jgi:hypothetical protein
MNNQEPEQKPSLRLSEDDIQRRVRSLRAYSGPTGTEKAASGVAGGVLGLLTWIVRLLRIPIALIVGGVTFYVMYPLNTCLLTGAVAIGAALVTFAALLIVSRAMEMASIRNKMRSRME